MKIIKTFRLILSPILLIWGVFAFLAGTDIYHDIEPDLSNEWFIFSTFFYLSYLFVVINVIELLMNRKHSS